jgi:DNA (cytosine-5)-methyltransferase 1
MIALFQHLAQIAQQVSGWTYTSMYCGAGGDSYGAWLAGAHVLLAINHNRIAITSHEKNFKDCRHLCMDIFSSNPDDYPATDVLWVSADCRNHSPSKGMKLKNQRVKGTLWDDGDHLDPVHRTRMTMMETYRWASAKLKKNSAYRYILLENVTEIELWPYYHLFLAEMRSLGYEIETLSLNSQHFAVPQSRDRWYAVCWLKGLPRPRFDFLRPLAMCLYCEREIEAEQFWKDPQKKKCSKYGKQYVYRCPRCHKEVKPYTVPVYTCIDWSIPAPKIKDRHLYPRLKDELAPNTLARIQEGLRQYCAGPTEEPFLLETCRSYNEPRHAVRSVNTLAFTQTTAQSIGLVVPPAFLVSYYSNGHAFPVTGQIGALTGKARYGLVQLPASRSPGEIPPLEECAYRMLSAHECKRIMGFPPDYILVGSEEEKVAQAGRAVTPPVATALTLACIYPYATRS